MQDNTKSVSIVTINSWRYVSSFCNRCGKHKNVRIDVYNALQKKGKQWECQSCVASVGLSARSTKHGKYNSGAYRSWKKMKERCLNRNHVYAKHYSEKGVTICEKWLRFDGFYDDMGDRPDGYSLDRVDNAKGYQKNNCRWIPLNDQPKNRSCCKKKYEQIK